MMQISVVMATYNGAKYLEQQILSILSQTLPPAELIVCDDRSTDGTLDILKNYSHSLTYVINDQQLGLIGNFRKAVSLAAQNNYIALSDQDDEWMPNKLERCAAVLSEIEDLSLPCMVYSDLLFVNENDQILNNSFKAEQGHDKFRHTLQTLLYGNFVNGNTILMNKELRRFFCMTPLDFPSNHDGWLALIAYTFGKAGYIPLPLIRYRKHENNVSIAADVRPRNRYRNILSEFLLFFRGHDTFLSKQLYSVRLFYEQYKPAMSLTNRKLFERFLELESKSYFYRKIVCSIVIRKYKL
jgi:glycosyltransferase involved in cell wall biosynthesis